MRVQQLAAPGAWLSVSMRYRQPPGRWRSQWSRHPPCNARAKVSGSHRSCWAEDDRLQELTWYSLRPTQARGVEISRNMSLHVAAFWSGFLQGSWPRLSDRCALWCCAAFRISWAWLWLAAFLVPCMTEQFSDLLTCSQSLTKRAACKLQQGAHFLADNEGGCEDAGAARQRSQAEDACAGQVAAAWISPLLAFTTHARKQGGWLRQRTWVINKGHAARQQTRCAPHGPPGLATLHATACQLGCL